MAHQADAIVGSAMGGWDGRRGWIYHVATSPEVRRSGLATRLITDVETRLAGLGARRVDLLVREGNDRRGGVLAVPRLRGHERDPVRQGPRPAPAGTDTADD